MPRASWRGFLRLSLVSCPIYLSPAATRTKPIRLHQVWQPAPADVDEDDLPDRSGGQQGSERSVTRLRADNAAPDGEQSPAATRITLRPHDPGTGEEIEKRDVVKDTNTAAANSSPLPPRSSRRSTSKAQRWSIWRSLWRAMTSIRSISTARTTSIPMARSRSRRSE